MNDRVVCAVADDAGGFAYSRHEGDYGPGDSRQSFAEQK
jgi:hypothetical protein